MLSTTTRKRHSETAIVASGSNSSKGGSVSGPTGMSVDKLRISEVATSTEELATINQKASVRLKVRLKRFHGVAAWSWNANDDVCGICQSAFEGTAPGVKYPGEDCPVVWGKCGHAFHLQCVSKWLSQSSSKNSCPICRQEWEFGQNPVNTDSTSD
jgi:anaphase-promoting complex subunit 11